ncbi:MAG TPA: CHAT domain-containing tetratricopeptide repeat protein [Bacteroidota bacterium]|nr:CHAT domain-containing tetratricopeptide repeat protein [Bacteroidota bacterium]
MQTISFDNFLFCALCDALPYRAVRRYFFLAGFLLLASTGATAQVTPSDTVIGLAKQSIGHDLVIRSFFDSSLAYFKEAKEIFRRNESWGHYVECDNSIADALIRLARFNEALDCLRESQKTAKAKLSPNDPRLASTYAALGYLENYNQEYAQALSDLNESLRIRRTIGSPKSVEVASSLYLLALTYKSIGMYKEAVASINEAIEISRVSDTEEGLAINEMTAANILSDKGDYHSALSLQDSVLRMLQRIGKEKSLVAATCYYYRGKDLLHENRVNEAISSLLTSLALNETVAGEIVPSVSACLAKLGEAYSQRSDYDRAISYFNQAEESTIAFNGKYHSGLAELYNSMANLYSLKGNYDDALRYARKSLAIEEHNHGPHHLSTANSLERLGDVFARHGDYDSAITTYAASLAIKEELNRYSVATARLQMAIGNAYTQAGKDDSAEALINISYRTFKVSASSDSSFIALYHKSYGDLLVRQHQYRLADEEYEKAMALLSREDYSSSYRPGAQGTFSGTGMLRLQCLLERTKLFKLIFQASHDPADLDTAYTCINDAIVFMTALRRGYKAEGSRLFLREEFDRVYKEGVETAHTLYAVTKNPKFEQKAFECAERAKSNLLLDKILESNAIHFSGAPDSILEQEASLESSLTSLEEKIQEADKNGQTEPLKQFRDNYFAASVAYNSLLDTLESSYPEYFKLKYQDEPPSIAKIQGSLDSRTTAVEYFFADSVLYIFTVSQNSFDVTEAAGISTIAKDAKELRKALGTLDEKLYLASAASLYRSIFLPIKDKLHGPQIVIIPDGNLFYVPFEALLSTPRKNNAKADFSRLPYLIKQFVISYSYSLTLFVSRNGNGPPQGSRRFVGFAPVFDDSAARQTASQNGGGVQSLEFSAKEVQQIEELFRKKNFGHTAFMRQNATKNNFKLSVGTASYIHIASHGFTDEDHPGLSGLLFSGKDDSLADDRILYAGETYNLRLNADLVVLSSCKSGVGQLVNGEGLMAMTRGFFYSGAKNVIYSLWNVTDSHTNRLMVGFYDFLLSGSDIPSALRRAKLEMIRNDPGAFPSKWTSFVLLSTR